MELEGKVAVITGGNSGIGLAIAKEFSGQGADVVIMGRDEKTLEDAVSSIGKGVLAVRGDVSKLGDIERLYSATTEKFGKVDIVVANAGIAKFIPLDQMTEDVFDEISDINFKGAYFTVQKAIPHLNDNASIVLVSSALNQIGMAGTTVYSATKAALRSLARTISADLLGRGIRANVLSPGPIETPIFSKLGLPQEALDDMAKDIAGSVPMKRFGTSEEMAKAALFLASSASSYCAGSEIMADGGMSQL